MTAVLRSTTLVALITLGLGSAASAEIVIREDFETPVVKDNYDITKTSQKIDTSKWVRTDTIAYMSGVNGLVTPLLLQRSADHGLWHHRNVKQGPDDYRQL